MIWAGEGDLSQRQSNAIMTPKERLRRGADSRLPGVTPGIIWWEASSVPLTPRSPIANWTAKRKPAKRILAVYGYTSDRWGSFPPTGSGLREPRSRAGWCQGSELIDLCLYFGDVVLPARRRWPPDPSEHAVRRG